MHTFKTKWFKKWADKKGITDSQLHEALIRVKAELGVVDLGGHIFKVRIGREGQGRSGGYRTIVIIKEQVRSLFIFGFEKNDMDNIDRSTLHDYKKYAKAFLEYGKQELAALRESGALFLLEEK
jgi:hypothetical protein